jgi:hypothetical protein
MSFLLEMCHIPVLFQVLSDHLGPSSSKLAKLLKSKEKNAQSMPLDIALEHGHACVADMLLHVGAKHSEPSSPHDHPMTKACYNGRVLVNVYLLAFILNSLTSHFLSIIAYPLYSL